MEPLPKSLDAGEAPAIARAALVLRDHAEILKLGVWNSKDPKVLYRESALVGAVLDALDGLHAAALGLADAEPSSSARDACFDAADYVLAVMGEVETMRLELGHRARMLGLGEASA